MYNSCSWWNILWVSNIWLPVQLLSAYLLLSKKSGWLGIIFLHHIPEDAGGFCHQPPWIFGKNESDIFQKCRFPPPRKLQFYDSDIWFGRGCVHQLCFWCSQDSVYQTDVQSSWSLKPLPRELSTVFLVGSWAGNVPAGTLTRWRPGQAWRPPAELMSHRTAWSLCQSSWELDPCYYTKLWINDMFSLEGNISLFYLLAFYSPDPCPKILPFS